MKIGIAKEAFDRKISLLIIKLDVELKRKLLVCYVWGIALYSSETWTLRKLEGKRLESFEMWCGRRMEKIKWSEKVTKEQVFERLGEKRILVNNILRRNANCIGHVLRRICLLRDVIEGQKLLDILRNRRR